MVRSKSLGVSFGRKQRIEGIVKNLSNKVRSEGVSSLFNGFQQESSEPLSLSSQQRTERRSSTVNDLTKSVYQLPSELEFSGVVSSQYLSKGKQFGPFVGTITSLLEQPGFNHSLVCQIPDFDGNSYSLCLLTQELESSKWLKCIKSYTRGSYNVVAYNTPSGVMLQTVSDVGVGDELCIAYDLSYNTTEMKLDGDDVVYIGTKVVTAEQPVENINMREPVYASDDRSDSTYSVNVTEGQGMLDKSDTADDLPRPSEPTYRVMTADVTEDLNPTKEEEERVDSLNQESVVEEENENTKSKTKRNVSLLKKFLVRTKHEPRNVEQIPPTELNVYLSEFIVTVRKPDDKEYKPNSLRAMMTSFERHLKKNKYGFSIMKHAEFEPTRKVLRSTKIKLKLKEKGNDQYSRTSTALSRDEIQRLYEKQLLGTTNPKALLNTVCLNNAIHFGLRGCKEHRDMCWGDVKLGKTSSGEEYLEYKRTRTKGDTVDGTNVVWEMVPKMFSLPGNERDPVAVFKIYAERRSKEVNGDDCPFYLAVNKCRQSSGAWFKNSPLGINTLNTMMTTMAEIGGLGSEFKRRRRRGTTRDYSNKKNINCPTNKSDNSPANITHLAVQNNLQDSTTTEMQEKPSANHEMSSPKTLKRRRFSADFESI